MYNVETLIVDLLDTSDMIDRQIDVLQIEALKQKCSPYEMRTPDGSWPFIGLITSKAQVLSSLALLKPMDI